MTIYKDYIKVIKKKKKLKKKKILLNIRYFKLSLWNVIYCPIVAYLNYFILSEVMTSD